jgi:hypothetical protein
MLFSYIPSFSIICKIYAKSRAYPFPPGCSPHGTTVLVKFFTFLVIPLLPLYEWGIEGDCQA